jgi:ribose-phosphate pyrophosphokinase
LRAARAARKARAKRVVALVAHGLFMPGSANVLADPAIERLASRHDSAISAWHRCAARQLTNLPSVPLFAEAIGRLHEGRLLADLLVF